jgi:ABC-type uncharacterized transport system involved in gliding motility auxiliary subunit
MAMLKRILDLIGWLGTSLVVAAVVVSFIRPSLELPLGPLGRPPLARALALAGLACVLIFLAAQWRELGRWFARRQARYGSLALAGIVLVAGILSAVNYLAARHNIRWDLTAAKQFTLSEQTRKVLGSLKGPLKILVFAREDDFDRFRNILTEYDNAATNVTVEYVDVDKKPALAKQYQVQSYGTVVFDYQGRVERVVGDQEQELTNGLLKVIEGQQRKVYFVQGHGEKDIRSSERDGYKAVSDALAGDNYRVETLVLAQQGAVPDDATVVVVAGPQSDLLPTEADALGKYLRRGGKALFLIDPPAKANAPPLANLTALLKEWAIELGDNVVVDVSGVGQLIGTDASVPVAANYPSHAITERFNFLTAYPLARSVTPISGGVEGRFAQTFVETSSRSWAETDIARLLATGQVALEENKGDKRGPISIAAAVSATAPEAGAPAPANGSAAGGDTQRKETRVAVFGDSDFAANFALGIQGNRDLFLNTVNWLAQQETLIAIRPRQPEDRRLTLTADQQRRLFWLSLVVIPGLVIGSGVYTWWRRR